MVTTVIITPPKAPPGTGGATVGGGSGGAGDPGRGKGDGGGGDTPSAAPDLGTITITAPATTPTPLPPATPLGDLLNRPLHLRDRFTEFERLLQKPLAEIKVKAKKRLRPLGRAAPSLFMRLISPALLALFPSPIAEERPLGQKFPFPKQKPAPAPASNPPPAEPPTDLGTVTIEAPRDNSRPPKIGTPNLVALPIPGFGRARFLETKPARPPSSKTKLKTKFQFRPVPFPFTPGVLEKLQPEPSPRPAPKPAPAPAPSPFPSPFPFPAAGGAPPAGIRKCTCRTVDPNKKKKRKKKKPPMEPAQLEVEYTQGKQKVKVEGKVEKLCILKRVPIPKVSSPGVKISGKGVKVTGFRKTRVIRQCF